MVGEDTLLTVCRDDGEYIDCYTLASHGRVQTQQWVHHYDRHVPPATSSSSSTELPCWHGETDVGESLLMMRLVRDMVFVQVESVPECVRQPPQPCPKFVVSHDIDGISESAVTHWQTRDSVHFDLIFPAHTCSAIDDVLPPPLPPKPLHLSPTVGTRSRRQNAGGPTQWETTDDDWQSCEQWPGLLTHRQVSSVVTPHNASPVTDNEDSNSSITEKYVEEGKTLVDDNDYDAATINGEMMIVRSVNETSADGHMPEMPNNLTTKVTDGCDVDTEHSQSSSLSSLSLTSADSDGMSADKAGTLTPTGVSQNSSSCGPRRMSAPASQQHCVSNAIFSLAGQADCSLQQYTVMDASIGKDTGKQRECNAGVRASEIEKQYSLVRKKKKPDEGQRLERLAASGETALVEPDVVKSELTTHAVTPVTQTMSQVNMQQLTNHVTPFATSVHPPSATLSGVELLSVGLSWSTRCRQDMAIDDHVTAMTSRFDGEWMVHGGTNVKHHLRRLNRGSLLLAHQTPALISHDYRLTDSELDHFAGTLMAYDGHGCVFYVPASDIRVHGDPAGEAWFFPVPLTALQATVLLSSNQVESSFLVYRMSTHESSKRCDYNLAVCHGADVVHYSIVRNAGGDLSVAGHRHSFLLLSDLIAYFQHNKSGLVTRLGRPLSTAQLPVTAGRDYDARYELTRGQLAITGNIIANGRFGVVCAGEYRHQPVAIKVIILRQHTTDRFFSDSAGVVWGQSVSWHWFSLGNPGKVSEA